MESLPAEKRGARKGLFLIPSMFTAANIGAGFFALMGALRGFQLIGIGGDENMMRAAAHFDYAALAIGWAFLFDTLDGRIARMTRTTTEFGIQFDSIADMLTFGIAPAVLAYTWSYGATFRDGTNIHKLAWFVSFVYVMCAALRLARFNVQATRPRVLAEGSSKLDKRHFVGLPSPSSAGLIAALVHFQPVPLAFLPAGTSEPLSAAMICLVAALGVLMVSTLRYTSFKTIGTQRRSTRLTIILIASVGMLIYLFSQSVLLVMSVAYVLHGVILRLVSLFRTRTNDRTTAAETN